MQPGLINSILVKSILLKNKINNLNIKLILLVRNEEEAKKYSEKIIRKYPILYLIL